MNEKHKADKLENAKDKAKKSVNLNNGRSQGITDKKDIEQPQMNFFKLISLLNFVFLLVFVIAIYGEHLGFLKIPFFDDSRELKNNISELNSNIDKINKRLDAQQQQISDKSLSALIEKHSQAGQNIIQKNKSKIGDKIADLRKKTTEQLLKLQENLRLEFLTLMSENSKNLNKNKIRSILQQININWLLHINPNLTMQELNNLLLVLRNRKTTFDNSILKKLISHDLDMLEKYKNLQLKNKISTEINKLKKLIDKHVKDIKNADSNFITDEEERNKSLDKNYLNRILGKLKGLIKIKDLQHNQTRAKQIIEDDMVLTNLKILIARLKLLVSQGKINLAMAEIDGIFKELQNLKKYAEKKSKFLELKKILLQELRHMKADNLHIMQF